MLKEEQNIHEDGEYENDIHDLKVEVHKEEAQLSKLPNIHSKVYEEVFQKSIQADTREEFYSSLAKNVSWDKFPSKIFDDSNPPFYRWFTDGKINACYNCIDRHIENGNGDDIALIGYSCYTKKNEHISYKQLKEEVSKTSRLFLNNGVTTGDTIIIYMPMIVEAIIGVLACARIGAIHSVVFGGFASDELADRIFDAKPKIIFTASCGIEPRKKIMYYPIILDALNRAKEKFGGSYETKPIVVLHQREEAEVEKEISKEYTTLIYKNELKELKSDVDCVSVFSNHPLYILYTSGTTGVPKGIVRETGGHMVMLDYVLDKMMNIKQKDVFFSTSDIGWVVGHNYIIYGPLIRGATSIIFEGKPVGTPHCGIVWELIQKYKVKSLYTAPTAIRAIRREDKHHHEFNKWDISTLESVHLAGERCDPESVEWMKKGFGEKILVNDNYWQTETGYPICCNNMNIHTFPTLPGSTTKPFIGQNLVIYDLDSKKEITEKHHLGYVYIKLPLAPSFMLTLWKNDQYFIDKYITKNNEYYITGDAGYFDGNGYFHIMTRLDDIINVAGHRLSTGRMEEVLLKVDGVSEAAVVSLEDELKGEIPFAFVSINSDIDSEEDKKHIVTNCKDKIVTSIGAISRLKDCVIVPKLPKTRSGKILRAILKKILNKEKYKFPSTIEDSSVLPEIEDIVRKLFEHHEHGHHVAHHHVHKAEVHISK